MKFFFGSVLLLLVVLQLSAASRPCDPRISYHGSECTCESKLPYEVQKPENQKPIQLHTYAFAVRYPVPERRDDDHEVRKLDVEVQRTQVKEVEKKM